MLDEEDFRILEMLRDSVEGEIVVDKRTCYIDDTPVPHSHLIKFISLTLVSETQTYGDVDRFALNSTGNMILAQDTMDKRIERLSDIASAVAGRVFVSVQNGRVIRT